MARQDGQLTSAAAGAGEKMGRMSRRVIIGMLLVDLVLWVAIVAAAHAVLRVLA